MSIRIWVWALALMAALVGCATENTADTESTKKTLEGNWTFASGKINGDTAQASQMLQGLGLAFTGETINGNLLTELNLPAPQPYELNGKNIVPKNSNGQTFAIQELSAQKLTLAFTATNGNQKYDFELTFAK